MAGLLGDGWDDPKSMATLQLAAGLLSPGSFGQGLGRGLAGYQDTMGAAAQQKERDQIMRIRQAQFEDSQRAAKRQELLQSLPAQFMKPASSPGVDATGGPMTAMDAQRNQSGPGGFDFSGYAQALAQYDPTGALALQASLKKDTTPLRLASGEKLLEQGTYKELANNPKDEKDDPLTNLIARRDALPPGDPRRQLYDAAIAKATTHQPGTTVQVGLQAPVSALDANNNPVLAQPANRPGAPAQILTDPRDNKPLRPNKDPNAGNPVADAKEVLNLLNQAEPLIDKATSSMVGQAGNVLAGAFGASTQSAQAAAQLKAIEGGLIAKMPKMSGPQSDKDVLLYRQMAGQIGDPNVPAGNKRAAMKTIREINERHAGMTPAASPAATSVDDLVNQYRSK